MATGALASVDPNSNVAVAAALNAACRKAKDPAAAQVRIGGRKAPVRVECSCKSDVYLLIQCPAGTPASLNLALLDSRFSTLCMTFYTFCVHTFPAHPLSDDPGHVRGQVPLHRLGTARQPGHLPLWSSSAVLYALHLTN